MFVCEADHDKDCNHTCECAISEVGGVRAPAHPNREIVFVFVRACVRAGGRAGDQWMDVRSRFWENSVRYVFPFSLFAFWVVPFSLWTDFSDAVDSANFLWLRYEFLVNSRDIQWFLNELKVSSYDSQWALSEFSVSSSAFEAFLNEFLMSSSEFKWFLKEFLVSS